MSEIASKKDNKKAKNKEISRPNFWTEEEDKILKEKAEEFKFKNWNSIANFIPGRTSIQCSARYRRIRPGLVKGAWDKEEDSKLLSLYEKYGKNWAAISKEMPHRTGKQIRDRFLNSLDSKFERGKFTEEEDQAIIKYYKIYGNSWAKIAKKLKTRTGDMVKNRFYSSLKKNIFKNKSFLKKKREPPFNQKNKNKIEEESESKTSNVLEKNTTVNNKEIKEQKLKNVQNKIKESKEKKEEKGQTKQKENQKERKKRKEITNLDFIKDSIQENNEINNQKNKVINNISSTNNVSYDSNNYTIDMENKNNNINNNIVKNNSVNSSVVEFNENLNQKQIINNSENEKKLENDNNINFYLDENIKKNEIPNYHEFHENLRFNSDSFIELNENINNADNANNYMIINQKDEIDEKLEKLKKLPKMELENKKNLQEQLNIIFDLENIINQKLFSVQKEMENN